MLHLIYLLNKNVLAGLGLVCGVVLASGCITSFAETRNDPEPDLMPVCYDYRCKRLGEVELVGPEWDEINDLFRDMAKTPQQERDKIAQAIALMEQLTGRRLGTDNDKAKNSGTGDPGQMDCIDESLNTTRYLNYFNQRGWIHWHQVQERVRRNPFFVDIHWTAVVKDIEDGQLYAVDSWFRDNGREPVIMTLNDWKKKKERP